MTESGTFKIRPAGRHVLTIGRDLIQDVHAAVIEIVKNAYDADSHVVNIELAGSSDADGYSITIADRGHGMTRDDVINKWLVPSTADKLDRRISPSGRTMQGRKGVGRYATSVLGNDLFLETVTPSGEKTTVYVIWDDFADAAYLDEVPVLVETAMSDQPSGTRLTIRGDQTHLQEWNTKSFSDLQYELRKLQSPLAAMFQHDRFEIRLTIKNMPGVLDIIDELIEPFPIFEMFDYRIAGSVSTDGKGDITYSIQKARQTPDELITYDYHRPTNCGRLYFDIRVYDRDRDSINNLIGRGLTDEAGRYLGSNEARRLLNRFNGIGVYRNGFRIRPMGDPEFDWLKLNQMRVQNPSMKISSNQVIGIVEIESEELSGLVEKSARDGLREDDSFVNLKQITSEIINLLEARRFRYRRMLDDATSKGKVEAALHTLSSVDDVKTEITSALIRVGIKSEQIREMHDIIDRDQQKRSALIERLREQVAVYQGQATLGNIINVVLHEGRRPLNYFRNEIPYLNTYRERFLAKHDEGSLEDIVYVSKGILTNADEFVRLFRRLDPLAAKNRGPKIEFDVLEIIKTSFQLFEKEMADKGVDSAILASDGILLTGWPEDFRLIFDNLVENSIYWLDVTDSDSKRITVDIFSDRGILNRIDYADSGPGIDPQFIEEDVIFEPHFSTKPRGSGLGLAIAGEAATRNDMDLMAIDTPSGAFFRLQSKVED